MLTCLDFIRQMSFGAIALRMLIAVICGGLIGAEREMKRRPAGFRTHILICLGAAITTVTSQYLFLERGYFTDIGRLGAQVIAGIGFIGAGTIIVTRSKRVKGLTTAAGLWTSAIIGLACGAGYVECAVFATLAILFVELVLIKVEYKLITKSRDLTLYIEYAHAVCVESIVAELRKKDVRIDDLEITRVTGEGDEHYYCALVSLQAGKFVGDDELRNCVAALPDILTVEEM